MNRKPIYNLFIWRLKRFNLSMKTIDTWHVYLVFHVAKLKLKFLAELRSPWKVTLKILNLKAKKIWFLSLPTSDTYLQGKLSHEQGRKMASKRRALGKINVVCCGLRAAGCFLVSPPPWKIPCGRRGGGKQVGPWRSRPKGSKLSSTVSKILIWSPPKKSFTFSSHIFLKRFAKHDSAGPFKAVGVW